MKSYKIFILLFILINTFIYSQEKYVEKYPNGNLKVEGFLVGEILDSIYKEYYENGNIKEERFFKNCEYETNRIQKYITGCGVGNIVDKLQNGKKHGTWKSFDENGTLKSISNYHCDFFQGNFYTYDENGKLESLEFTVFIISVKISLKKITVIIGNTYTYDENGKLESLEFYTQGDLLSSTEYNKYGFIEKNSFYTYLYNKKESQYFKTTREFEYYEDGKVKIQREIIEKENDVEIEHVNEYFSNGFLKSETVLIDFDKNGVYREYYENGNVKYAGIFKEDKPFEKQYYYSENGKPSKIEYWKKGKLIKTEIK